MKVFSQAVHGLFPGHSFAFSNHPLQRFFDLLPVVLLNYQQLGVMRALVWAFAVTGVLPFRSLLPPFDGFWRSYRNAKVF
jgi:hypothetical protein